MSAAYDGALQWHFFLEFPGALPSGPPPGALPLDPTGAHKRAPGPPRRETLRSLRFTTLWPPPIFTALLRPLTL